MKTPEKKDSQLYITLVGNGVASIGGLLTIKIGDLNRKVQPMRPFFGPTEIATQG